MLIMLLHKFVSIVQKEPIPNSQVDAKFVSVTANFYSKQFLPATLFGC